MMTCVGSREMNVKQHQCNKKFDSRGLILCFFLHKKELECRSSAFRLRKKHCLHNATLKPHYNTHFVVQSGISISRGSQCL